MRKLNMENEYYREDCFADFAVPPLSSRPTKASMNYESSITPKVGILSRERTITGKALGPGRDV